MESTGNVENVRGIRVRNDRVFPETRWVSVIIVPFLVAAFVILYLFPDHTNELFAWGIQPRMSAMMLGAAYIGGAYFFFRVVGFSRWHFVKGRFLPVAPLSAVVVGAALLQRGLLTPR